MKFSRLLPHPNERSANATSAGNAGTFLLMRFGLAAALSTLLLTACGGEENLPQKPQLIVDRLIVDFGSLAGRGTYVGTEPEESMQIKNGGLETLKINSVTKQGDPEFRFEGPLSTEVKGKQTTFIRVFFKPTSAKRFTGSLTLDTNSEVTAERPNPLTIQLQGDGTNPPDAGM